MAKGHAVLLFIPASSLEHRTQHAEYLADLYENITCKFCFPEWMRYNAHLQLAIDRQDQDACLSILKKMLPAMKKEWNLQRCQLYRYANDEGGMICLSSRLADSCCRELSTSEEYAFIRDNAGLKELIARFVF